MEQKNKKSDRRYLQSLGHTIDRRIKRLQSLYLSDNSSAGRAALAQLRDASSKNPGESPAAWDWTYDPQSAEVTFDEPTYREWASHIAMTTFAIHQQSKSEPMHVEGVGLGQAMHRLVGFEDENPASRARYEALITADSLKQLQYQLRTTAALLRGHNIPLDYAMLAENILQFQYPDGKAKVRLLWSRQYYATSSSEEKTNLDENKKN